ncbi:MAG: tetratricopeptide repeat protein [Brevinematales bacterium]
MKQKIGIVLLLVIIGCSRNPTLRSDIKKGIERTSSAGITAFRREEYESAKVFFEEALKQAYQLYLPLEMVKQYANLAETCLRLGFLQEANTYLQEGEKIASQESIQSFDLLLVRARYFQRCGEKEKAKSSYESVLKYARTKVEKILGRIHYADFYIEQENWREARRILEGAGFSLWFFSDYDILGLYYYSLGLVAKEEKNYERAFQDFRKALAYDQKAENLDGIRKDLAQLGEICRLKGDELKAVYYQEILRFSLDKKEVSR